MAAAVEGDTRVGSQPARPSSWLFGQAGAVEVWAVDGDERVHCSVFVRDGRAVILLNRANVGTEREHGLLDWAMNRVAEGQRGFFVYWTRAGGGGDAASCGAGGGADPFAGADVGCG